MAGETLDTPAPDSTPVSRSGQMSRSSRAMVPVEVRDAIKTGGSAIGKYITTRELGQGGMGVVYQAWDPDLGRWIALKLLKGFGDGNELARFLREAQTCAQLVHPNIAQVYDAAESPVPYLAIQFIDGVAASTYEHHKLPVQRAAEIIRDAALALDFAHRKNIIHRDVKPQNMMVAKDGQVFVLDFGLAKTLNTESSLSMAGGLVGTPNYMSPEQAQGARNVTRGSDVYSLGASLYFLITGRSPSKGKGLQETLHNVVHVEAERPSSVNPKVPPDLDAITLKALEKEPRRRYLTAKAFADDLQRFLLGDAVSANVPSPAARFVRWTRKNKGTASAIASIVLLLVALTVSIFISTEHARRKEAEKDREAFKLLQIQSEVERIGHRIASWQTVIHDPPHAMAPEDQKLEALIGELDALKPPKGIALSVAMAHKGMALALLDKSDKAIPLLEESLAGLKSINKEAGFSEEGRFNLLLAEQHLRVERVTKLQIDLFKYGSDARRARLEEQVKTARARALEYLKSAADSTKLTRDERGRAQIQLRLLNAGDDAKVLNALYAEVQDKLKAGPDPFWYEMASTVCARLKKHEQAASYAASTARILESSSYHVRLAGDQCLFAVGDVNKPDPSHDMTPLFEEAYKWQVIAMKLRPDDPQAAMSIGRLGDMFYWYHVHMPGHQTPENSDRVKAWLKESTIRIESFAEQHAKEGETEYWYRIGNNLVHLGMMEAATGGDPTEALEKLFVVRARVRKDASWKAQPDCDSAWGHIYLIRYWNRIGAWDSAKYQKQIEAMEKDIGEIAMNPDACYAAGSGWWDLAQGAYKAKVDPSEAIQKAIAWASRGIDLKEEFIEARVLRANIYLATGNPKAALADFEVLAKLRPNDPQYRQIIDQLKN